MKYRTINKPKYVSKDRYFIAIEEVVSILSKMPEVKSIYRIGNINNPGISDIDLLVIFKSNKYLTNDIRSQLSEQSKYLYTHQLFGISEDQLEDSLNFSLYHNFEFIFGEKFSLLDHRPKVNQNIQEQIALEYLVKLYVSLSIQIQTRVIKLRSFLLEANAVKFDLEILNIENSKLKHLVKKVTDLRNNWFDNKNAENELISLFSEFYEELKIALEELSKHYFLHVQKCGKIQISRGVELDDNSKLELNFRNKIPVVLPLIPNKYTSLYFRIWNRFSTLKLGLPLKKIEPNTLYQQKVDYEIKALSFYNLCNNSFIPLKSPLILVNK